MKLLITGCGRSGTKYITHVLNNLGIYVQHEKRGRDGTVDWHQAKNLGKIEHRYDVILHQVRHPLKVISSCQTISNRSWNIIGKEIPIRDRDSLILKCMKYWYYWNKFVDNCCDWTYQLEQIKNEEVFVKFCSYVGVAPHKLALDVMQSDYNKRSHDNLSWDDLRKENKKLTSNIMGLARIYKYDV